jgi:hypothetical protein
MAACVGVRGQSQTGIAPAATDGAARDISEASFEPSRAAAHGLSIPAQQAEIQRPNQVCSADITYVRLRLPRRNHGRVADKLPPVFKMLPVSDRPLLLIHYINYA